MLVRKGQDFGISGLQFQYGEFGRRLVAVKLEAPGRGTRIICSVYLEVGKGLPEENLIVLSMVAALQE